jgi:hypothetical protein
MSNQLFEYYDPARANMIVETGFNGKDLYMSGIFAQAEKRNQNQRVYPLSEISKAVEEVNGKIASGQSLLGELDHPEELTINLDRVSHVITEMTLKGNDGYGKLKVLPTPCGEIAKAMLSSDVILGVSTRGSGNVGNDGYVSEFEMITVDIVAQPSAPEAFPRAIYESLYNMKGGTAIMEVARAVSYGDISARRHLENDIIKFIKDLKL